MGMQKSPASCVSSRSTTNASFAAKVSASGEAIHHRTSWRV